MFWEVIRVSSPNKPTREGIVLSQWVPGVEVLPGTLPEAGKHYVVVEALNDYHDFIVLPDIPALHQMRHEWVLRRAGIENLLFAGIVTNGGVASTVRDAHVRDFHTLVLKDGCAAFSEEAHQSALSDLSTVSNLISCEEATSLLRQT